MGQALTLPEARHPEAGLEERIKPGGWAIVPRLGSKRHLPKNDTLRYHHEAGLRPLAVP